MFRDARKSRNIAEGEMSDSALEINKEKGAGRNVASNQPWSMRRLFTEFWTLIRSHRLKRQCSISPNY